MNFHILLNNIKHNQLFYSYIIILIAFLFSRLPFFIWMPMPLIYPDAFDYYSVVQSMVNGTFKGFGILPPGYILFLYIMEKMFSSTFNILLAQNLISLIICLILTYIITKKYKKVAIYTALALSFYIMDSDSMRADFSFYPEALYRNSLLIITALLISVLNSKRILKWIFFSVALIIPALFRSNGLYIYFLPVLIIIYMLINKFEFKYYVALLTPFIVLNLCWCVFNFSSEGYFFPGNPGRLSKRVSVIMADEQPDISPINKSKQPGKLSLFWAFSSNFASDRPQFYYTYLKDNYQNFYVYDIIHDPNYLMNDWTTPIDTSLRRMVYKEYYTTPNIYKNIITEFNIKTSNNIWLKAYHIYYKFHSLLINNYIWLVLYVVLYIISFIRLIKSRLKNKNAFIYFSICSIHYLAILSLTVFGWFQARYIQVSEFIVYLTVALAPLLFIKQYYKPDASK